MQRDEIRAVTEERGTCGVPLWVQPEWSARWPWLVQGTTGRGDAEEPFDLGVWGRQPVGPVLARWLRLRDELGVHAALHVRQVHGAEVRAHASPGFEGLLLGAGYDGHLTAAPGLLLTVSVADCVPVFLVCDRPRVVGALHAGWRGTAAGIVEGAIAMLQERWSVPPADLHLHCGPAICGECYEVGPEVHRAVDPARAEPSGPGPIDLRAAIARRAGERGIRAERITASTHCTRCGPGDFFSYRGASPARQVGVVGLR